MATKVSAQWLKTDNPLVSATKSHLASTQNSSEKQALSQVCLWLFRPRLSLSKLACALPVSED